MSTADTLYVPGLAPALKHPTVFRKFDALQTGESFVLVNDHDPIPLYYELKAERGDVFAWKKLENGPEQWVVEITKKAADVPIAPQVQSQGLDKAPEDEAVLNVTLLEPRQKHPAIFRRFDALQPGEAFQILNDHDPKPLYYQLIAERGPVFSWQYIQTGPEWWQVEIKKNAAGETVGEIAARDVRKAEVFKKYGIDFCCGGKKTLRQACADANIDVAEVEAELDHAQATTASAPATDFTRWEAGFLADYIYNQHHLYYYEEGPVIRDLAEKVAARHGMQHPQLYTIQNLYRELQNELQAHFEQEEQILFPFIKELTKAKKTGDVSGLNLLPSVAQPVHLMEQGHEAAGEILKQIRRAADDYTAPLNSCQSYQLLYKKLAALEADLHQHIHLENNVLFPKALALEKELRR